jgi:PBP1b-binding outer membrane lipoprotein LpoB
MSKRILGTVAVAFALSGCANGSDPADTSTVAPVSTTTTTKTTTTKTGSPSAPEFAPAPGGDLAPA